MKRSLRPVILRDFTCRKTLYDEIYAFHSKTREDVTTQLHLGVFSHSETLEDVTTQLRLEHSMT